VISYRHATAAMLLAASSVIVVLGGLGAVHMPGVIVAIMASLNTVLGIRLLGAVKAADRQGGQR
jgi:hypothetical protein